MRAGGRELAAHEWKACSRAPDRQVRESAPLDRRSMNEGVRPLFAMSCSYLFEPLKTRAQLPYSREKGAFEALLQSYVDSKNWAYPFIHSTVTFGYKSSLSSPNPKLSLSQQRRLCVWGTTDRQCTRAVSLSVGSPLCHRRHAFSRTSAARHATGPPPCSPCPVVGGEGGHPSRSSPCSAL